MIKLKREILFLLNERERATLVLILSGSKISSGVCAVSLNLGNFCDIFFMTVKKRERFYYLSIYDRIIYLVI